MVKIALLFFRSHPVQQTIQGGAGMAPMMEDSNIDIASVKGRVKESAVKKVNEIIDQHPEESLSLVRGWMAQGEGKRPTGDES